MLVILCGCQSDKPYQHLLIRQTDKIRRKPVLLLPPLSAVSALQGKSIIRLKRHRAKGHTTTTTHKNSISVKLPITKKLCFLYLFWSLLILIKNYLSSIFKKSLCKVWLLPSVTFSSFVDTLHVHCFDALLHYCGVVKLFISLMRLIY